MLYGPDGAPLLPSGTRPGNPFFAWLEADRKPESLGISLRYVRQFDIQKDITPPLHLILDGPLFAALAHAEQDRDDLAQFGRVAMLTIEECYRACDDLAR